MKKYSIIGIMGLAICTAWSNVTHGNAQDKFDWWDMPPTAAFLANPTHEDPADVVDEWWGQER